MVQNSCDNSPKEEGLCAGSKTNDAPNTQREELLRPPSSQHNVPPPETFCQIDPSGFSNSSPQREKPQVHENSSKVIPPPQRLVRRSSSSLFSQLPVRKSRLFGDIGQSVAANSVCNQVACSNVNGEDEAEHTVMDVDSNLPSQSQPTWLGGEDHLSISKGISRSSSVAGKTQLSPAKSTLFGAVMQKFGSGLSSTFSIPSSPFRTKRSVQKSTTNINLSSSTFLESSSSPSTRNNNTFQSLIASPSGKSILNLVNQFHSPFKFQSPTSGRRKRRKLWEDPSGDTVAATANDDDDSAPKKRIMLEDDEDDDSKPTSSNLFSNTNDSRSSLCGGQVDESWREALIVDTRKTIAAPLAKNISESTRMEFVDWSLSTKIRIEAHGGMKTDFSRMIGMIRQNQEALTYWMYSSPVSAKDDSINSGALDRPKFNNNLGQKSNGVLSRQATIHSTSNSSSRFDITKRQRRESHVEATNHSSDNLLADYLIRSVRGPSAPYSRKNILHDHQMFGWYEGNQNLSQHECMRNQRLKHEWQQSLQSLFSNYRRCLMEANDAASTSRDQDVTIGVILDTYFYCVGEDHSVLFRAEFDSGKNGSQPRIIPVVLVSSTSESFRKHLKDNGLRQSNDDISHDAHEDFQLVASIHEREARERKKVSSDIQKSKRLFSKAVLMSPGIQEDLEALRRAQAFGESAGADVSVKINKPSDRDKEESGDNQLPKAISISGWENVSLFFEVYWNQFGNTTSTIALHKGGVQGLSATKGCTRLPVLISPNTDRLCRFEHASMKRLSFFPGETMARDVNSKHNSSAGQTEGKKPITSVDVSGVLLPCTIRKLLVLTRNHILFEDGKSYNISKASKSGLEIEKTTPNETTDFSPYVVLHLVRPKPAASRRNASPSNPFVAGFNGTLLFNDGKSEGITTNAYSNDISNRVFECSSGKVVSMVVWDASRKEVAACKLDSAFPENWFNDMSPLNE